MLEPKLIGRKEEQSVLRKALISNQAELISVIGRRRVGKTFLVQQCYKEEIVFEYTGVQNAPAEVQIANFHRKLEERVPSSFGIPKPNDWFEAFGQLKTYLKTLISDKKSVVFIDELPWLAAGKSDFVPALGYFWNSWAVKQPIVIVVCGSAASWMIEHVVNDTGSLYNRISRRIFLEPFKLADTERYLKSRNVNLPRRQIAQIYMVTGGIPQYLKAVEPGQSAAQTINTICFTRQGALSSEFDQLYPALFSNATRHILIVRALASKHRGLTRNEIVKQSGLANGGSLTNTLEELAQSSFVTTYRPFAKKKKETLYRLTDEYSLFYLRFMEGQIEYDEDSWQKLSQSQMYKIWSGYAFENLCLKHIREIKKALGISGIISSSSSFYRLGNNDQAGLQIDLLIDRNDQVINLCEAKFYDGPFSIGANHAENLRNKASLFRQHTKTRKHLIWTMITSDGLKPGPNALEYIPTQVILDQLFE
ncbi:MAG: ATP-binding protein [Bacteroidota bacterium]